MATQALCQSRAVVRKALTPCADLASTRLPVFIQHKRNVIPNLSSGDAAIGRQIGLPRTNDIPSSFRSFHSSPILKKKKDKGKKGGEDAATEASSKADATNVDPFDLSQLNDGIRDAVTRLKNDVSKLRSGGRFNPEALENLRVHLVKGGKETIKLGQLAQVVPKGGRIVTVLVGEEDHVKPTMSAIVASDLSLTPQQDSRNPLQLNITIPPPTKESREQTVQVAKAAAEKAANAIRNARGSVHKRLQDMQKKKLARPDDIRKAHDEMEKVQEKGQKEVKDIFEATKKALEQA
ncbi:ribosome recycling factor domain-containing protein [Paecilomyces variotii No. 5]|uniref:Ribosome recycling factor domain-containing protein n=1 Tax=Byssochlamys spectabilis (strain No. 5 / NBRC 109023) TaxID=1356009 RepID=V5F985_BYSSN|nr:ribosome recycling factor domain-containing protein [Paecilomyces variotii No. 5]